MAITQYAGRSVDLFLFQGAKEGGMVEITPSIGLETGGKLTTGAQKAAQTFAILFLTEKGTVKYDENFGTTFITDLRSSNISNSNIQILFNSAADDVLEQQNKNVTSDMTPDEVLSAIELVSFSSSDNSSIELVIKLTTLAGTSREYIVPISMAIK